MSIANPQDWEKPGGWSGGLRWGVAALAVVTVHAAAAWFFVQMPPVAAPPQGVPEAPIFIDLAPPAEAAPAAPAVETPPTEAEPEPEAMPPEPLPPEPTPEPQPEPEPEVTPPPEPLPPEPPPQEPVPEPVPPEPTPPPPEPLPPEPLPPEPLPPEPLPPEPVVPEPLPPEPVVPEPPPEVPPPELPVTEQPAEAVINAPVPRARPTTPPPERQVTERRRPPERREAPVRREVRPRTERQAAPPPSRASRAAANASQGATPRSNVSPQRWQSQVQARLNRFKRTPRGGGTGTVQVRFTVGANGAASGIRLSRSSGNPILDEAALSLVARASPFPATPSGSSVSITVPIAFTR